jgi:hypothetical protein
MALNDPRETLTSTFPLHEVLTAICQWRKLQATLKKMQRLSRQVLFETVPGPIRRKRLGKKVLGLI